MKRLTVLIPLLIVSTLTFAQPEEEGHMHGPDGRHIVTAEDAKGASSFILSHHDMRIEGADGKIVLGAEVNSKISPKDKPSQTIHTEKNAYEPENEVYGSHMTYTEPGEYVLDQDVTMPDGKKIKVEFPVYVPAVSAQGGAAGHDDHHGPNYLLIVGGALAAIAALYVAFRMGKKSVSQGVAGILAVALVASLIPSRAFAQEDEAGHMHGPDGRHIVTETDAANATGPQLKAYPGPNQEETATKTVDGIKFVLSIENEEMKPDLDLVSVSKEQMNLIGLKTANAEVSSSATGLQTTGKVSANPNGLVKVNSRTSGRVIRLGALPGTSVRRGQMLAVIESAELADAQAAYRRAIAELSQGQAGIKVAEASIASAKTEVQVATRNLDRQTRMAQAGEFSSPALERAKSEVSTSRSAWEAATAEVARLDKLVNRLRSGIQSGVVAQRDLDRAESELAEALASKTDATTQLRLAQESLSREEGIAKQGLRNAREVDQARAQLDLARSSQRSAESRLLQARADLARVQNSIRFARDRINLLGGGGGGHIITITAPISGEVEHRFVSVGQTIGTGELLYDLLNADIVWVLADVYESDVPKVRIGQQMTVVADAYPDEVYEGEVAFVHNEVDPQTRTTQVRIVISNPGERLKQNMFVRVNLGVGSGNAVTVPSSAVQNDKGLDVVFVEEKAGVYRRTLVQIKGTFGDRTVVEGIVAGRKVATSGSYQLMALGGSK
ncbi:MAG: efflux RND transporter periplasmic adaptor subunit [Armatimonadetes bacterium]|nr:efflux RND transporter periplasmic adaptor subunit [Armatimonadota bacterium]